MHISPVSLQRGSQFLRSTIFFGRFYICAQISDIHVSNHPTVASINISTGPEFLVCLYINSFKITNLEGVTPGTPGSAPLDEICVSPTRRAGVAPSRCRF
jgi:hypothetical protein